MAVLKDGNSATTADEVAVDFRDNVGGNYNAPKKKAKTKEEELNDLKKEIEMVRCLQYLCLSLSLTHTSSHSLCDVLTGRAYGVS